MYVSIRIGEIQVLGNMPVMAEDLSLIPLPIGPLSTAD